MSNQVQYIIEVNELIEAYGLEAFAKLLGLTGRGIQYWLTDQNPKKPGPKTQKKIHELFTLHKSGVSLVEPQDAQKEAIASNGVKQDYLSGKNLENFSEAHNELVKFIARAQPGIRQDQALAPKVVQLIREQFSGKKQVPIDELLKLISKALTQDNGHRG